MINCLDHPDVCYRQVLSVKNTFNLITQLIYVDHNNYMSLHIILYLTGDYTEADVINLCALIYMINILKLSVVVVICQCGFQKKKIMRPSKV